MHHVDNPAILREAYFSLKREAAPGVDRVTWRQYGGDLEGNLLDLCGRLQRGAYRAKRFRAELTERLSKFALELHPDKTRLIEFGPFAAENRRRRGQGKPETFDFLGFTHICGTKWSDGRFTVLRQTMRKRLQAKLGQVKTELRRRLHDPVPEVGSWLRSVVGGHLRYYGVPTNSRALRLFRLRVGRLWYRSMRRRSQKTRLTWERWCAHRDCRSPRSRGHARCRPWGASSAARAPSRA